ncbi:MAG TPA: HEAT repeat domain-containing protein [Nitrososphaerales archaeon]|nr:HEAT repeat domain-containing protein [Nitrososphaerales archaeon]
MYTSTVIDDKAHCMDVMDQMETAFSQKDESFFLKVLRTEPSLVLRVHAVCILAEVGGEKSIPVLSDVLLHDPDPLVKHEAAFSMGQIGLTSANVALEKAMLSDPDPVVRHESAAALGSIGSPDSEQALAKALSDGDEIVSNSARASLFNIEFLRKHSVGPTAKERAPRP